VQIPFLEVQNPGTKIVPIEMRDYRLETCMDIAHAIARAVDETCKKNPGKKISAVASSDMTHCGNIYGQIPPSKMSAGQFARRQDEKAIEQMLNLNPEKLLEVVRKNSLTMCGSGPAAAVLEAARNLGAARGELAEYSTSADVSGKDSEMAVGYAGIVIR
jgi:AmmeMemoRadiSam system protein B